MLCSSSNTLHADAGNAASHEPPAHTGGESFPVASFAAVEDAGATPLPAGTPLQNGALLLGAVLGRGGFGITYLGRDVSRRRYVAIKEFFPPGCARRGRQVQPGATPAGAMSVDSYVAARHIFLGEAKALARFAHPGIVAAHGVFEENNTAYLVMEYLQGKTLHEMAAAGPLSEREALDYIRQVAAALEVLHHSGVIHRDINPANVIVCAEEMRAPRKAQVNQVHKAQANGTQARQARAGAQETAAQRRVVVVDFGLNCRVEAAGVLDTKPLAEPPPLGTPGYAPLEQYTRRGRCGPATDIYALAATLHFLLTGQAPPEALERAQGQTLPSPRRLNPKISNATSAAIEWAMEMQSDDRPQSVRVFLDALAGAAAPARRQHPAGLSPAAAPVAASLAAATVSAADVTIASVAPPVTITSPGAAPPGARAARPPSPRSRRGRAPGATGSATSGARALLPTLSLATGVGAALAACALWLSPWGMPFGTPPRESDPRPLQAAASRGPARIARSAETPAPPSPITQPPLSSSPRNAPRMALGPRAARLSGRSSGRAATVSAGAHFAGDATAAPQRREGREPIKRRRRERIASSFVEQTDVEQIERPIIRAMRPRRRREEARTITMDRITMDRPARTRRPQRQVAEAGLPPAPIAEAGLPPS